MVRIPNQPRHNGPKRARIIIQLAILNRRRLRIQASQIATVVQSKDQFKTLNQKTLVISVVAQLLKKRFQEFLLKIKKTNKKIYASTEPARKKQKRKTGRQQQQESEGGQQNTRTKKRNKPEKTRVIDTVNLLQRMQEEEGSSEDSRSSRQRDLRRNRKFNEDDSSKQGSKKSNDDSRKNLPIQNITSQDFQLGNEVSKPSNLQGTMTQPEWEDTDYLQNQNYSQGLAEQIESSQSSSSSSQQNLISNFQQKKKIFDDSAQQKMAEKKTKKRKNAAPQLQNQTIVKQKKKNLNITLDDQVTLDDIRQMHNNTSILQILDSSIQKMQASGSNFYYQIIPRLQQICDTKSIFRNKIQIQKLKLFAIEKAQNKPFHRSQKKKWQLSHRKNGVEQQDMDFGNISYQDAQYQDIGFDERDMMIEKRIEYTSQLPDFFSDNPLPTNLFNSSDMNTQMFIEDGKPKRKTEVSQRIELKELARRENKRFGALFKEMLLRAQKGDVQMSQQNPERFGDIFLIPSS